MDYYHVPIPTPEFEIDDQTERNLTDLDYIPTEELFCKNKYKKMLVGLNISLEPEFVISAELAVLRRREEELDLSAEQQEKVREVRKKGRNNMHAMNCRQRKVDNLADLQRKVEAAKKRREINRNEYVRLLQEKQEEEAKLHHLELQVDLQEYLQRQQ